MFFLKRFFIAVAVWFRLMRVVFEVAYGQYKIFRLPYSTVSIFGGSRLPQDSVHAHQAYTIANALAMQGVSVLTGGGPGIMEAANCGAMAARGTSKAGTSMGIGIGGMRHEQGLNLCAAEHVVLNNFFSRKWLLINYSIGFVVFPGGLGTLDELSDLLNLMQTGKRSMAPVILVGVNFWKPYEQWLLQARREGLLSADHEPRVTITDDLDQVVATLVAHCRTCRE